MSIPRVLINKWRFLKSWGIPKPPWLFHQWNGHPKYDGMMTGVSPWLWNLQINMCNPKKILSIPRGMEVNISQEFFLSIMDQHICCDIHGDVVYPAKLRFFVFKLIYTLWLFNIAMENGPLIDDFPNKTSIYKGFSMAMLNNQMVYVQKWRWWVSQGPRGSCLYNMEVV